MRGCCGGVKDVSEKDPYGRLLRYVVFNESFVNYVLVKEGFASVASYPPDISCIETFRSVEKPASVAQIGIWGAPPPTATLVAQASSPSSGACNCSYNQYNCSDGSFSSKSQAQSCYDYCKSITGWDVHDLDRDNDGLACESGVK